MCHKYNVDIIEQAYTLLESTEGFLQNTFYLQVAFFENVSDNEYKLFDYKLKAIRQDFAKILVTMNSIKRTYSQYCDNKYESTYVSIAEEQATSELGCLIEYMFIKYRVILEYIQQILEICICPRLSDKQKRKYHKKDATYLKYEFLLNYIAQKEQDNKNLLNTGWFQRLRIDRNLIVHNGATCVVFGDKESLLFKLMTTDAMDNEDDIIYDDFYTNENGLIYYTRYWALQMAKLIIFSSMVFRYLKGIGSISPQTNDMIRKFGLFEENYFVDENGDHLPNIKSVLIDMLNEAKM